MRILILTSTPAPLTHHHLVSQDSSAEAVHSTTHNPLSVDDEHDGKQLKTGSSVFRETLAVPSLQSRREQRLTGCHWCRR